ncbi:MAG: family 78 glycoside hydrolase catalytic domain [Rikenellaceae bacterium]
MRQRLRVSTQLLLLFFTITSVQSEPTNLRVDYIRTPQATTIASEQPIFSWQLATKGVAQRAYEIIVSKDAECSEGDMWESRRVRSDNTSAILYRGERLEPEQSYYWRVRYWDKVSGRSDYSAPQQFTMASTEERERTCVTANPLLRRLDESMASRRVGEGEYLYDFGRAAFGVLKLRVQSNCDTTLIVRAGEQLRADGRIERKPKGTIRAQEMRLEVKAGENVYPVTFVPNKRNTGELAIPVPEEWGVIMPFRYVEVCGVAAEDGASVQPLRDVMYGYREDLGSFNSSNKLLDSIWEISRYTIEATDFLGYYIDGERERIPYEADAYINQLSHYCIDSEYAIGKRTLEYFMSHATWPTEWLLHTIMIAYQDYIYTGDTRLITKYYDKLKAKSLYELSREDGLISAKSPIVTPDYLVSIGFPEGNKKNKLNDIVDWPMAAFTKGAKEMGERDDHDMRPINTVVNCFHYEAMRQMAEIAAVVGRDEDVKLFESRAAQVKRSINEKLLDSERGVYIDGEGSTHSSLHSNMFAIAFDIVEKDNVESVVEFVKSRGMACSVYGAQYLFEALYKAGEAQYALDLMTNRSDRGWYNMIRIGSTMTLEGWDIKYKRNLDWNHAWGAAPANLIPRYMWGATPTSPGYRSGVIRPQLADLEHSAITVPTLNGVIEANYTNKGGVKRYEIDLPPNMTVRFESPDGKSIELSTGNNVIVIED